MIAWLKRIFGRRPVLQRGAFDLERFKQRLAVMPADDPLWPMLLQLLDAYVVTELGASTTAALSNEEAQRFRGRLGMLQDLRADLERIRKEVQAKGVEIKPA